jgi:HEPN domain-containing protein
MQRLTAEWVKKAEADHGLAEMLGHGSEGFYDQICFHCQQCAEKYLKALLQELGLPVPRTHNLLTLRGFCFHSIRCCDPFGAAWIF